MTFTYQFLADLAGNSWPRLVHGRGMSKSLKKPTTLKKKGKTKQKKPSSSWQPTLKHYFGGKSVLVQPTISHFVKNLSKSQPLLEPKQETTDIVVDPDSYSEDCAAVNYDLSCDKNAQVDCEKKSVGGSNNPFAIKKEKQLPSSASTPNEEGLPLNQVKPQHGRHKLLSLKDRKRKHRTLSISPQSAESCGKKACSGVAKNENVHPNLTNCQLPNGNVLRHSKRVMDGGEEMKVSDARQLSCEFTTEEAALMHGYALDSERSHTEKLSLADLDFNAKLPSSSSISSAIKNLTPSKDCLLSKMNSIPCSPSFSPRKPAPKTFSPFFERTRPSSADGKGDRLTNNSHVHVSESNESSFESSAVLFSTPAATENSLSALSSHSSMSKSVPRRTLDFNEPDKQIPIHPASPIYRVNETVLPSAAHLSPSSSSSSCSAVPLPPAETMHQASTSNEDFSFIGDISLSEFADVSRVEMEVETSSTTVKTSKKFGINRHLVLEVTSQECGSDDAILCTGRRKSELLLRLLDQTTNVESICYLRDDWLNLDVSPGDVVQVNADYDNDRGCFVIDNSREEEGKESSIIVHPDCLVSGTSVANSITCTRKAVLAEMFKGLSDASEAMTIGRMLHEVFQRVLLRRQEVGVSLRGVALKDAVMEEIRAVVSTLESLNDLYCLGMSEVAAMEILYKYVPAIMEWCEVYMKEEPTAGSGEIEFKRPGDSCSTSCIAVTDVLDIEENIWSPRFGLKGKVDVSVMMRERRGSSTWSHRVPLELKTGKMQRKQGTIEHRAQLTLYSVMFGDRYETPPPGGLLYYLKGGHMQGLPTLPHEKRGLLIARNHLARYHSNQDHVILPSMLRDSHTCKYCSYLKQCTLYHKAVEHGGESSSGLGELFSKQVDHLPDRYLQFFAKWYGLLAEEERCCKMRDGPSFWLSTAQQREKEGTCLANMIARASSPDNSSGGGGGGGKVIQSFSKSQATSDGAAATTDTLLTAHDRVVISRQDGSSWAVAMGTILSLACSSGGTIEVRILLDKAVPCDSSVLYRIDQPPSFSRGSVPRTLAELCASDSERDQRLRELVIDLAPPRFKQQPLSLTQSLLPANLNPSQQDALTMVLSAQDYVLVLGMPGTGKTTTIARLVEVLVAQGISVLLTSYTHSAVDNILLKLKQSGVDFLRLGSVLRVHPSLHPHTPAHICRGLTTVQAMEEIYHSRPVVATTCLGINHPIFMRRSFDVCVVDEASQITLPASLGPLRYASRFVLVGDHYQLPPLVQSQQARDGGLDTSLFRYLSEHHPNSLVSLREQYRMNREIMSLSNTLIYNNRLVCGSEEVACGRLSLPLRPSPPLSGGCDQSWMERAVDPSQPVVFLNTDSCSRARETIIGDHTCNEFEANLVRELVLTMIKLGLDGGEIGVITPLRQQQNLIREKLQQEKHSSSFSPSLCCEGRGLLDQAVRVEAGGSGRHGDATSSGVSCCSGVEVNTVDKYQGRDKECVMVSCTRSNSKGNTGSLLRDWRRINVALTRAKHKLILIGSCDTLGHAPLLKSLLDILRSNSWIIDIPPNTQIT